MGVALLGLTAERPFLEQDLNNEYKSICEYTEVGMETLEGSSTNPKLENGGTVHVRVALLSKPKIRDARGLLLSTSSPGDGGGIPIKSGGSNFTRSSCIDLHVYTVYTHTL